MTPFWSVHVYFLSFSSNLLKSHQENNVFRNSMKNISLKSEIYFLFCWPGPRKKEVNTWSYTFVIKNTQHIFISYITRYNVCFYYVVAECIFISLLAILYTDRWRDVWKDKHRRRIDNEYFNWIVSDFYRICLNNES